MGGSLIAAFMFGAIAAVTMALSTSVLERRENEVLAYSIYTFITYFIIGYVFELQKTIIPSIIILVVYAAIGRKIAAPLVRRIDKLTANRTKKKLMSEREKFQNMELDEIFELLKTRPLDIDRIRGYKFERDGDTYDENEVNISEEARYKEYLEQYPNLTSYDQYYMKLIRFNGNTFDADGFDINGLDFKGFNREGYRKTAVNTIINGKKVDFMMLDREGYDKEGYDRHGFNKMGMERTKITSQSRREGKSEYNPDGFKDNGIIQKSKIGEDPTAKKLEKADEDISRLQSNEETKKTDLNIKRVGTKKEVFFRLYDELPREDFFNE